MTKVIKGEFETLETLKINDVSLTCDASLENFHNEFNRLSNMDDDLFTYKVEIEMVIWNNRCHKNLIMIWSMIHLMSSLLHGDDEVKLTDEQSSDSDDKIEFTRVFRIETNMFDFETPLCRTFKEFNYLLQIDPDVLTKDIEGFKTYEEYKEDWIYKWNKDVPWVHEKPWTDTEVWTEPALVVNCCKPSNNKSGCSEWPTRSWRNDGYCNEGNFFGAYIIGNSLHYHDYEWYKALEDGELKKEALRNKAIMERTLDDDDDNETHELPVCNIRRFEMIKYSFGDDKQYVTVKEDEYDDLMSTSKDARRAYQEIFRMMEEGWMVTREGMKRRR
nr:hypothetical protein [Tanacetum cinerariifolium]